MKQNLLKSLFKTIKKDYASKSNATKTTKFSCNVGYKQLGLGA